MEKIVLVTGGFDPLHSGHLAYLKAAKKLGDKLFVGINSDDWLCRKKGKNFLTLNLLINNKTINANNIKVKYLMFKSPE